jgi:hypothetical protein
MIPSPLRTVALGALLAAGLAACGDKRPEPPRMAEVLPNLPLPPNARFLGRSGGEDALQIAVIAPLPRAQVESYYRDVLTRNGWRLVNQAKDPDGALVFLAEQDGPPLWVRIRAADDTASTVVEFSGARMAGRGKPTS